MKKLFIVLVSLGACGNAMAAIYCNGTINAVYKWANMTSLSITILMNDGTVTNWINMPTKSDESMALAALMAGKHVALYWAATDVSVCSNGWVHNRTLDGFFVVEK